MKDKGSVRNVRHPSATSSTRQSRRPPMPVTPIHLTLDLDRQGLVRHGLEGTQSTHVVIAVRATKLWLVPSAPARGHS